MYVKVFKVVPFLYGILDVFCIVEIGGKTIPRKGAGHLSHVGSGGDRNKLTYAEIWHKNDPKMGVINRFCDDGKSNLEVDWPGFSSEEMFCDGDYFWPSKPELQHSNRVYCHPNNGKNDNRMHICTNFTISYDEVPPLSGNHRPLWPQYGEYRFVPQQRWIHNLEHGAVVLLYHPCANRGDLKKLREVVTSCLRRHVITPYRDLPEDRPFALVVWGCKLSLAHADEKAAVSFIKEHALHGGEDVSRDGQYTFQIIRHAQTVPGSDLDDHNLCPGWA